jgi:hypothetical protein
VTGDGGAAAAAYHPVRYELAVGYGSGAVRVFDVATTALLAERDGRGGGVGMTGGVAGLAFTPEGSRLFAWRCGGGVVALDASRVGF